MFQRVRVRINVDDLIGSMKGGQTMATLGKDAMNENLGTGASADNLDKKAWRTPLMEKLNVTVHTQNNIAAISDGPGLS
jgi:hypothetical protein